jgi:F-type H+-transporting ATPase subunit O
LENPAVAAGEKEKIMMDMMPAKEFSDITRNLMSVVSANGRVSDTNKIIGAYEELMQASKGQVSAVIISAEALDKATLAKATKAVTGMLTSGQTANVTTEVNPDIMGGLQVKIGDKFMDLSVSSRIIDVEKVLQSSA